MTLNQLYSEINPTVGEIVIVQFTKRNSSFFEATLLEYSYIGMMTYKDATKKRRIYNWNKIIPLNKDMVARVDTIDEQAKIVQISISHLCDLFTESLELSDIQDKLMIPFNENKILYNFIKSVSVVNQIEINIIWEKLIHYVDSQRRKYNDDEDNENDDISLWKYFNDNFNDIDTWCEYVGLNISICESIKNMYAKRFDIKLKYTSKIGIISPNGINTSKDILKKITNNFTYNYTLKYDSAPYYIFETSSTDTCVLEHEQFISELKKNTNIFIKVDYMAKEIKL